MEQEYVNLNMVFIGIKVLVEYRLWQCEYDYAIRISGMFMVGWVIELMDGLVEQEYGRNKDNFIRYQYMIEIKRIR